MTGTHDHPLEFEMPACSRHFFKGHKWWCRACDRQTEAEFRDTTWALWELQGAGDRIVREPAGALMPRDSDGHP